MLTEPNETVGGVLPTLAEVRQAIAGLKADLMFRGEASELFGLERDDALSALLGNLDQSVFGEPAYPTIESKAGRSFIVFRHQKPSTV